MDASAPASPPVQPVGFVSCRDLLRGVHPEESASENFGPASASRAFPRAQVVQDAQPVPEVLAADWACAFDDGVAQHLRLRSRSRVGFEAVSCSSARGAEGSAADAAEELVLFNGIDVKPGRHEASQ